MHRRHTSPVKRLAAPLAALAMAAAVLVAPQAAHAEEPTSTAPLIVIDPGHGGPYSNANANGLREKDVNLRIAQALRDTLAARGYRVLMTRETDTAVRLGDAATWNFRWFDGSWHYRPDGIRGYDDGIPEDDLQARADIANAAGADLFISVHANGSYARSVRGFETYASGRDALGRSLGPLVQRSVVAATGFRDGGFRLRDFYVCRWTNMPSILIEAGYISNPYDAALLKSAAFIRQIAEGAAAGVDAWYATSPHRRIMRRVTGATPEAHSAAVAGASFPAGAPAVVLARSDRWAEAAPAVSLAKSLGGPLLWLERDRVTTATAEALARLKPARVVIVGTDAGLASVSVTDAAVAASLPVSAVSLVAGSSAATLAASIAESTAVGPRGIVFIASSATPRALMAAAPVAASFDAPLLVCENGALPPAAVEFLRANAAGIRRVMLVGSPARVPASLALGEPTIRYSAPTGPALASLLNAARFKDRTPNSMRPLVADMRHGPEYLAASVRAATLGQPLVPAEGRVLPALTREWITNRRSVITTFEVHNTRRGTPYLTDHLLAKAEYL